MYKILSANGETFGQQTEDAEPVTIEIDEDHIRSLGSIEEVCYYIDKVSNSTKRHKRIEDCETAEQLISEANYGTANNYIRQQTQILETVSKTMEFKVFKELCYSLRIDYAPEALVILNSEFSYFTNPSDPSNKQLRRLCYISMDYQVYEDIESTNSENNSFYCMNENVQWIHKDRSNGIDRFGEWYKNGIKVINLIPGGIKIRRSNLSDSVIWSWVRFVLNKYKDIPVGSLTSAVKRSKIPFRITGPSLNSTLNESLSRSYLKLIETKSISEQADISDKISKYLTKSFPFMVRLRTGIRNHRIQQLIDLGKSQIEESYKFKDLLLVRLGK